MLTMICLLQLAHTLPLLCIFADFNFDILHNIVYDMAKKGNSMLYTYTAVITESDGTFYAKVPDIDGCITTAKSLSEAITLITGALNLCLVVLEDENIQPVPPTPQADISHAPSDILTIIQADTIKYRSLTDSIKKSYSHFHKH